ncbi:MAG: hypothetical protein M3126_04270 [Candidatus Eremiobacteraeota bacterium]|nr:hypothetical protein [Candidatus Eremiobacteraeota bacterium]
MTLKLVAAGGTFAGSTLGGLVLGAWLAGRTGHSAWVAAGIFAGLAAGGYAAVRLALAEVK